MRLALPSAVPAVFLLVALGALAGCRSGSALHRRYDNFRAYYNTYYNASQKLEEGERALLNVNTPVDRGRLVDLFPTSAGGSSAVFSEAIDKSAELLRQRGRSKWADDALLIIGKSYFYERNVVGAEQKFRETIAAAEISGDRRLADEARFWLGRTMAAADRYDEGVLVLREALELPDGNRYWTARMHLALGELYARAGRWDAATVDLRDGIENVRDADLAARAALLLGQVEEAAGRYEAAAEAYGAALDRRPAYEVSFAAEINRGLVLGLDAGQSDESLRMLRAMSRDDKNYARRAEVALAQARVLAAAGLADDAGRRFRDVLYDPALAGQSVRGEAHFRLAEFYRDVRGDYVTAAAHFDTAATAITAPVASLQPYSRSAIVGADGVAATYESVARTSLRIAAVDSLLALGALDADAFEARIAEIESVRRAEWVQQRREADALRTAQDFGGGAVGGNTFDDGQTNPRGVTTPGTGGSPLSASASTVATGFLGFRDPRTIQTGLLSFQRIYGDRALVPNWRRQSAVQAGASANAVGAGSAQPNFAPQAAGLAGPPPLDLSGIPRTPAAVAELVEERAGLRYELANTFFLALGRADRASVLYQQILDETPDAAVAARARYALAELASGEGRTEAAAPLYRGVVEADSLGALGQAARARLEGRDLTVVDEVPDRRADEAYAAARTIWDDGDPYAAAVALVALGDQAPGDAGAPRAFFAAALAFADWARSDSTLSDSLALAAPLPPALVPAAFDSLATAGARTADSASESAPEADEIPDDLTIRDDVVPTRGSRRDRTAPAPAETPPVTPRPALDTPRPVADDEESRVDPPPAVPAADLPAAQPDTTETPARLEAPEAFAPPDSLQLDLAPADSLASGVPALAADSSAARVPELPAGMTLREYLVALSVRYSGTSYATRARAMADVLDPSRGAPGAAPAGTPAGVPVGDPSEPAPLATAASPTFEGLRGSTPINLSNGGFSWQTGPFETFDEAQAHVATYDDADLRVAIASRGDGFMVLLGLFETPMAAAQSFEAKRQSLFVGASPLSVEGLALVGPTGEPLLPEPPGGGQ